MEDLSCYLGYIQKIKLWKKILTITADLCKVTFGSTDYEEKFPIRELRFTWDEKNLRIRRSTKANGEDHVYVELDGAKVLEMSHVSESTLSLEERKNFFFLISHPQNNGKGVVVLSFVPGEWMQLMHKRVLQKALRESLHVAPSSSRNVQPVFSLI